MDKEFFKDLTYGMMVLSTNYKGRDVGCFINTAIQITSSSTIVAVSVNKTNFTNKAIKSAKKFAVSILSQNTNQQVISRFGFYSSRDVDKFDGFETLHEQNLPIINENICGYMLCELIKVVSVDTHDIFLGKVIDCKKVNDFLPLTYSQYQKEIKGKGAALSTQTVKEKREEAVSEQEESQGKQYKCIICGHIYDEEKEGVAFEELPEDWVCPICGVGKEFFQLV